MADLAGKALRSHRDDPTSSGLPVTRQKMERQPMVFQSQASRLDPVWEAEGPRSDEMTLPGYGASSNPLLLWELASHRRRHSNFSPNPYRSDHRRTRQFLRVAQKPV